MLARPGAVKAGPGNGSALTRRHSIASKADGTRPIGSTLDRRRSSFAFRLDLGYALTFDTDTLSPHEYLTLDTLRYEQGKRSVEIHDREYYGDPMVLVDGQQVGDLSRTDLRDVAELVRAQLT